MKYRVLWNYKTGTYGPWKAGDIVDVTAEEAEQINQDSPGVLAVAPDPEPVQFPHVDRMVKISKKRSAK